MYFQKERICFTFSQIVSKMLEVMVYVKTIGIKVTYIIRQF